VVGSEAFSYLVVLYGFSVGTLRASDMGYRVHTFGKMSNNRDATKAKTFTRVCPRKIVLHSELTVSFDLDANYRIVLTLTVTLYGG